MLKISPSCSPVFGHFFEPTVIIVLINKALNCKKIKVCALIVLPYECVEPRTDVIGSSILVNSFRKLVLTTRG